MLGLADSNDPTPPIRLGPSGMARYLLRPLLGLGWIAYGAVRIGSSLWEGVLFLVGGVVFLGIGAVEVVAWRRDVARRRAESHDTEPTDPVASSIG